MAIEVESISEYCALGEGNVAVQCRSTIAEIITVNLYYFATSIVYKTLSSTLTSFYIAQFSDVANGSYTVEVTGSFSGSDPGTEIIYTDGDFVAVSCTIPTCDLIASASTIPDINGLNQGSITISGSSSFPREYSLNNVDYQPSNVFNNLAAGSYVVYVRDSNPTGCSVQLNVTVPSISCDLVLNFDYTPESFTGAGDGSITATATSAQPGLQYSLNGGTYQSSGLFEDLSGGIYTITARDQALCTQSATFTLPITFSDAPIEYFEQGSSISYSTELQSWSSEHSYTPNHAITKGNRIFLYRRGLDSIYEMGKGPKGVYFDSVTPFPLSIELVVNDAPNHTKSLDNLVLVTSSTKNGLEVYLDTITKVQFWNQFRNSGEYEVVTQRGYKVPLSNRFSELRMEFVSGEFRSHIPVDQVIDISQDIFALENLRNDPTLQSARPRMSGKYLVAKLTYDNADNNELTIEQVRFIVRFVAR